MQSTVQDIREDDDRLNEIANTGGKAGLAYSEKGVGTWN